MTLGNGNGQHSVNGNGHGKTTPPTVLLYDRL